MFLRKVAVPREKIINTETAATSIFLVDKKWKIICEISTANPNSGRYNLCSYNASLIGIMLDSTESVIKNQNIAKAITDRFFMLQIPMPTTPIKNRKANGV